MGPAFLCLRRTRSPWALQTARNNFVARRSKKHLKNIRVVQKLWIACFSELLFSIFISNRLWPKTVAHFVPRHAHLSCLLCTTDTISSCSLHSVLLNLIPQQSACKFPLDEYFQRKNLITDRTLHVAGVSIFVFIFNDCSEWENIMSPH